ncbi:zinc finger protein 26 [Diabrotica virgifera virgifera]|uniref:C2H2-type domain-containing protein n=3 Tax=Diabrotica virgifera virgifera TaxID=50390 RepID=A0ABM5L7Y3_DIAVI|nr:zinc finger protein 26 [Diabrotica virgifera virgifera]
MDVKVKIEHEEEIDLPDLIDPQSISEEYGIPKHEIHTCSECLEDFNSEFLLKVHQMLHDKTQYCFICKRTHHSNFKEHVMERHFNECDVCFKNFSYRRSLVHHMELHTGNLNYIKCEKCDKKFRQRSGLSTHMRSYHEGIKPFACKQCEGTFTTSSSLKKHVRNMHNPNNPKPLKTYVKHEYDCDVCSKQITNKRELELHYKEHYESNKCKLCGKEYKKLSNFKFHVFRHHFLTETCTCCGKLFHKRTIEKHMQSHDVKKAISFCEICNKPFGSALSLSMHLVKHRTARCKLCGLTKIKSMEKHLEAHRKGKVQKCSICGKIVGDIDAHNKNTHRNTQFIFCTMCPEKFTSVSERNDHHQIEHFATRRCPSCKEQMDDFKLDEHCRKYHPECVYECDYCDDVLYGISSYNAHLERHTKKAIKPYMCNNCLKSYKSEAGLKMHTCTSSHYCHLCNRYYTLKRSYKTHMIRKHSPQIITANDTENLNVLEIGGKKLYQCKRCFLTMMFRMKRRHYCHRGAAVLVRRIRHHKCNLCGFLGASMGVMRRHCFKYHENESDWVTIKVAGKKPLIRRNFIYKCHCGRRFKYERTLSDHRSECLLVKPFKCRICDSRFICKGHLLHHLRKYHVPRVVEDPSEVKNLANAKGHQLKRRAVPSATVVTYRQRKKALKCKLCEFACFSSKFMGHHRRTYHDSDNLSLEDLNYKLEVERYVCKQEGTLPDVT